MVDNERLEFIRLWADYVRTHEDREWSRQQNKVIDSQINSVREFYRRYPEIKKRILERYRLKGLKK
jgi:hypothetical protein